MDVSANKDPDGDVHVISAGAYGVGSCACVTWGRAYRVGGSACVTWGGAYGAGGGGT
jgi:hypothetical protein